MAEVTIGMTMREIYGMQVKAAKLSLLEAMILERSELRGKATQEELDKKLYEIEQLAIELTPGYEPPKHLGIALRG